MHFIVSHERISVLWYFRSIVGTNVGKKASPSREERESKIFLLLLTRSRTIDLPSGIMRVSKLVRFLFPFEKEKEEKRRKEATVCFDSLHEIAILPLEVYNSCRRCLVQRDRATWKELIFKIDIKSAENFSTRKKILSPSRRRVALISSSTRTRSIIEYLSFRTRRRLNSSLIIQHMHVWGRPTGGISRNRWYSVSISMILCRSGPSFKKRA